MTKLNTPLSLNESISADLSQKDWQWGVCHALNQGVPFSLRNGPTYAQKLVDLFRYMVHDIGELQAPFNLYEYGAGTGFLTRHIIRLLKEQDAELYAQCTFYLTEGSESYIQDLKNDLELCNNDQVKLVTLDVTTEEIHNLPLPSFAYSVYLLDALPTQRFCLDGEAVKEVTYNTSIPKHKPYIDSTTFPPTVLNSDRIESLLQSETAAGRLHIPLLSAYLETKTEHADLTDKALNPMVEAVKALPSDEKSSEKPIYFHYSQAIQYHLNAVSEVLEEGGVYVVSDFGQAQKLGAESEQEIQANYGTTQYYAVSYPLYTKLLPNTLSAWITDHELDQTQEWVLYSGAETSLIHQKANALFKDIGDTAIAESLEVLTGIQPTDESYDQQLEKSLSRLSEHDKQDYFLLKSLSTQLIHDQRYSQAIQYLQQLDKYYGPNALHSNQLKGTLLQLTGQYQDAILCYDQALMNCENDRISLVGKAVCHALLNDFGKAETAFKKAIRYSSGQSLWENIMYYCQLLLKMGKEEQLMDELRWYPSFYAKNKSEVPDFFNDFLTQIESS